MLPARRKPTHIVQTPTTSTSTTTTTTTPSKLSHVTSPVLFMTVDGEPMRFFLCPGPAKVELQPRIKAGGGTVCRAQEPGAVLLVDPDDVGSLTESTAHRYVSVQYIRDCVEKNEQLELEDYRVKPHAMSTRKTAAKTSSTNTGRTPYTSEEDNAIISYVSTRNRQKGNVLWQEMENCGVTNHSWQSMKCRYINKLMGRPAEGQEDGSRNGDSKMAENQETVVDGSSPEIQTASSPDDLTSSDLAQPDDQQPDDQQPDDQQPDDLQMDDLPIEAGNINPPTAGPPPDPEEEEEVEEVEVVLAEAPQQTSSPMKKTPKMAASPATPQRRSLRCQMLLDTPPSDTPSRKKARTSSPCSSPKASTSAASPSSRPPPPQHQLTESNQSADGGANPVTPEEAEKAGKRKGKRRLGFLEMATREFEGDSESDCEETPDQPEDTRRPGETASKQPTGAPDVAMETRAAVETGSAPRPHLFIFDSESQEEGSQPVDCDDAALPADPRPIGEEAEVVSLSQAQLKEDMGRIRELIKQSKQDLVSVTRALLKTSGNFSAALALLLNPASAQGPFWSRCDDRLLLTSNPKAHRQLQKTYGEQGVARRLVFLKGGR